MPIRVACPIRESSIASGNPWVTAIEAVPSAACGPVS